MGDSRELSHSSFEIKILLGHDYELNRVPAVVVGSHLDFLDLILFVLVMLEREVMLENSVGLGLNTQMQSNLESGTH
ncbi:hypothetical protein EON65_26705 [archaeon]|nr:MAG: hypothetical protein EON65_26705 [archaeon]